jgi:hypothetical protein
MVYTKNLNDFKDWYFAWVETSNKRLLLCTNKGLDENISEFDFATAAEKGVTPENSTVLDLSRRAAEVYSVIELPTRGTYKITRATDTSKRDLINDLTTKKADLTTKLAIYKTLLGE